MSRQEIIECIEQLKIKNCEGYDHIPQRILIDGIDILVNPLIITTFFINLQRQDYPGTMANCKNYPNSQKKSKNNIENYRPVASLCSTSKIFERLILNKISKLEKLNEINLVGKTSLTAMDLKELDLG